jgi:hypothetical protein
MTRRRSLTRVDSWYDERLTVPWYWWPPALAVVGMVAAQLGLGVAVIPPWLPAVVLVPVTAVALWWSGRLRVWVVADPGGGELRVDDARLPLRHVADAIPVDAAGQRELLGPAADPLAFVVRRPWMRGAVQVVLDDPADPTPYWLISAPAPERLAAALTGADPRAAGHRGPGSRAG